MNLRDNSLTIFGLNFLQKTANRDFVKILRFAVLVATGRPGTGFFLGWEIWPGHLAGKFDPSQIGACELKSGACLLFLYIVSRSRLPSYVISAVSASLCVVSVVVFSAQCWVTSCML